MKPPTRRPTWDPLRVGPAVASTHHGMAAVFHESGGRSHHYQYRHSMSATECLGFANRLYNGFALVFEDKSMHLSFKRNDRAAVRDWRHFQAIKNEVAGAEREAIEIFPAESNLRDAANEYHLWVLPPGEHAPFGLTGRGVGGETQSHDHAAYRQTGRAGWTQRGWEDGIPTGLGAFHVAIAGDYGDANVEVTLLDGNEELLMWTSDEWKGEPSLVAVIANAIRIGYTEGVEGIRSRLDARHA